MTTLVGWVGVQSDGPSSIYLASDSRVSWGATGRYWDGAKKLFAAKNSPDLFGYCGDALIASQMLSQIVDASDHGLLFSIESGALDRHAAIIERLKFTLQKRGEAPIADFSVVHVSRDDSFAPPGFLVWRANYSNGQLRDSSVALKEPAPGGQSERLFALGSGAQAYIQETIRWNASAQGHTSRAYFTALSDMLSQGCDQGSGGPPQLVGLYRVGNGRAFGIVHEQSRYFQGLPLADVEDGKEVEWRDETFQRVNAATLKPLPGAQRQVRPPLPSFETD